MSMAEPMEQHTLLSEAETYLRRFHHEHGTVDRIRPRLRAIRREVAQTGTYRHTAEELAYGAQVAWRNSNCCIGRLHWWSLPGARRVGLRLAMCRLVQAARP